MSEYLYKDPEPPKTDHPDSAIRLASVVHRFRVPQPVRKVKFSESFSTVGRNDKTRKLMLNANDARVLLKEACTAKKISAERVIADARRYQPMINTILISCKVQPEQARLDEKLVEGVSTFARRTLRGIDLVHELLQQSYQSGILRCVGVTPSSPA